MNDSRNDSPRIVVIGAGISGLAMAIRLKQQGFNNLIVLEQSDGVGGTWRKNSYPNAGCDIPSYLYSFSFAPNYDWSMKYARQPEILAYLESCVDRFQLQPHLRLNVGVESARFDSGRGCWIIQTNCGQTIEADILVSGVGQLNRPYTPPIDGLSSFQGETWHSARWNHNFDLTGKRVAVVGSGASAIQFLPTVASQAAHTHVIQRTPSWIQPLDNHRYSRLAKWMFRHVPWCAKFYRLWIFLMCEWRIIAFRGHREINRGYASQLRRRMRKQIPEQMWEKLIPQYAPGCKRILMSNDYLETLRRENVTLVTDPIQRLDSTSVVTENAKLDVDAIIFATGFKATEFMQPMEIVGRESTTLSQAWADRPKTLYGVTAPGFPNLFMLYGPNTNLGHNSIMYMIEHQVDYVIGCLQEMQKSGMAICEVKTSAVDQFDKELVSRLGETVWAGDCSNWYKLESGHIANNWWGSALAFARRVRRFRSDQFEFSNPDSTTHRPATPHKLPAAYPQPASWSNPQET